MNRYPHAPLTPEERELAERLARLGPHDGPPAELDAKILAAAHRAVDQRPALQRRRWLGLSGGAGGLVTGLGFAASLTLVLGVVWQMRPMETIHVRDPAADTTEHVILVDALPSAEPRNRPVPAPATLPASPGQAPAKRESRESADAGAPAPASIPTPPATEPARAAAKMAAPEASAHELEARAAQEANAQAEQQARQQAGAAEQQRREAAEAQAGIMSQRSIQQEQSDDAPSSPGARRATYTGAARATPERTERARQPVASAPSSAPEAVSGSDVDPAAQADSTELDSIVLTGSRVSPVTSIPLHEDTALGVVDWLERIRARRDAGDIEDARESLSRFRRAHPRVPLPEDLAELARGDVPGDGMP